MCSAITSGVFVSGEVQTLRSDLSLNPSLSTSSGELATAGWGDPQTLLLVGDDQRALTKYYHRAVLPHSNEMLLVRIDPNKPWISMMSIPRELQVTIHPKNGPPVTSRFNYAYTAGGIPLLVSTIRQVLGVSVNHVMVMTFGRFKRAVDEMGCVYSTIDRRYYHANVPGGEQYQEIDLQPGYQNLCGDQALQFVSYRHTDTSLVRDARDQSLLLDVKKQYGPTLAGNAHQFEQIFGQAVQTDRGLHSTSGVLNLLGTLVSASGRRVRQVHFQANLGPYYDTATPQQIAASVNAFLEGPPPVPKRKTAAVAQAVHRPQPPPALPLVPVSSDQLAQARASASGVPFPYEYPGVQDRGGSGIPVYLRSYQIQAPNGTGYPIYVGAFATGQLGQFYDVQGTTWTAAPQFEAPDQTVHVGPRTYYLYYESQNLRMVAWFEHGAVYWIRNTLTNSISNGELLAIAEQTQPVAGVNVQQGASPQLGPAPVPPESTTEAATGLAQTLGSLAALLALLAIPVLALLLVRRKRELAAFGDRLQTNLNRAARLHRIGAGAARAPAGPMAGSPAVVPPPPTYSATKVYRASPSRLRLALAILTVTAITAAVVLGALLISQGLS